MKYLCLVLLFLGCTHHPLRPIGQEVGQDTLLFPDGRYLQNAEVVVTVTQPYQDFDFNCVVQKTTKELLFFGYNSFGISLFKIRQKSDGPIEMETSIEQIKSHQDFFIKVFSLIKTVLALSKSDSRLLKNEVQLNEQGIKALVKFSKFDALGIPRQMLIENSGQYKVQIQTTSYEVLKNSL